MNKFNLYKALSASTILFQVVGLQYFTLDGMKSQSFVQKHKYNFGIFIIVMILVAFGAGYWMLFENEYDSKEMFVKNIVTIIILQSISIAALISTIILSMINAYTSDRKTQNIFMNFEKISIIFSQNLNYRLDYSMMVTKFRKFNMIFWFMFIVSSAVFLLFMFFAPNSTSLFFLWSVTLIFPYIFLDACFIRFIFFTSLMKFHVDHFEKYLHTLQQQRFCMQTKNKKEVLTYLKAIYGIMFRTSELINSVCGFTNVILLGLIVFAVSASGYYIFLTLITLDLEVNDKIAEPLYTTFLSIVILISMVYNSVDVYESVNTTLWLIFLIRIVPIEITDRSNYIVTL